MLHKPGTKTFVGWSTKEIATPGDKPTSNFYEPGATVTLSAEQTFYAVYATEGEGAAEPEEVTWSYSFSSFSGTSVQYAEETHDLGGGVTINIKDCNINDQLRIYSSSTHNGYVVSNQLPGAIKSMSFNVGYKSDDLLVYGSTDGDTWDQVGEVSVTSTSYNDYTLSFGATNYTYFKLDVKGANQIRVAKMSITYMSEGGVTTTYSDYTTSCGATPTTYNVTIADGITNGTVTASPTSAAEGATITLTVTPADGYMLNTLAVADESSNLISLTDNTFEMPASNVTVSATFKEIPAATLTLSKNEDTSEKIVGKVGDVINLPTFTSDCSKTFVGWDSKSDCAVAPEYAPGAEYILAAETQTLYAVYADVVEGASVNVFKETFDVCEGKGGNDDQWSGTGVASNDFTLDGWTFVKENAADGCAKFGTGSAKGSAETPSITLTGNATLTFRSGAWNGTNEQTTLNVSATGANLSQASVTLVKAAWTDYTIYITEATGSVKIKFEAKTTSNNRFFLDDVVVSQASVAYSNYSTTCAAAPIATVSPTSVTTTASSAEGKVTVTYKNVNTANVAVALFNDAACTEAFTAGWLTASIDADKNISYTIAENTTYAERKAYIQLTAPETTGAVDPAVVVIPVTQAAKDKVFASLEALLAAITPTTEGVEVTVTLTNEVIQDFYTSGSYTNGIALNVPYQGGVKVIEIYCKDVPTDWVKGGKVSGTITCPWKLYNSTWELCPAAWTELTYTAPPTVSSIAVSGTPTKTTYIDGEEFDPAGLVVTATYTDASTEVVNAALVDWTFDPETLSTGETSVSVVATYNTMESVAYEVTGLTVNDIPTKTVAEFIAAGGGRCYLEGIVSNITNTTYGNFDLTDASGEIYIYGCLNASGESKKFATLGVKEGDKIKVIADTYELYEGTKQEAKNVQYVSHISAATITIANITMEVGETKTISATLDPAEAEVTYTIKENTANAISLSGNTITALAEGTATITATVAEGATYLSNTVDFTVTVNPQNIATLPFEFDGKQADIENTPGMSHDGIDATDYKESPYLKMNTTGDWLIIHFDERPGKLTYDIEANTGSDGDFSGTFTVQESADGVTYRNLAVYTTINTTKESKAHNCFDKDTRYIKFIFTTKNNGNVALGNIKIEKSVVTKVTPTIVENAYFSVGNNKYVQFSTGNLQYEVGTNTWSFASEQYEVIGGAAYDGTNNTNYGMNEPGYTGKLDLFGWSSDGKFGVNPSNTDAHYGYAGSDFVDWGELVNETGWYTLPKEEMNHILARTKDGKKLWALATVNNLVGLILLPDNWDTNINLVYGYIPEQFVYTKNQLSIAEWQTLEEAGAVFLPAGGSRTGGYGNTDKAGGKGTIDANGHYFHVDNVNIYGYYWLNTQDPRETHKNCASFLILPGWDEGPTVDEEGLDDLSTRPQVWSREKRRGNSVRLVKAVEPVYTRNGQTSGAYGTVCYPENIVWCDGATLYEVAGKEGNKVIFDEVTTPEAGMPYIFIAEKETINFICGTEYEGTAGKHNSLQGTFTQIKDAEADAAGNILEGNYMLVNNVIKKCGAKCGLKANRAYFVADDLENMDKAPAAAPGRRRISLDVTSENTTTGLDNITNGKNTTIKVIENGQLIIIRNGEKFNAQGIKL